MFRILAAAGVGCYFIVESDPGSEPEIDDCCWKPESSDSASSQSAPPAKPEPDEIRLGSPVLFNARNVFSSKKVGLRVIEITETSGTAQLWHKVSWLGIESTPSLRVTGSLDIASDQPKYDGCRRLAYPDTAVSYALGKKKSAIFEAVVDVEPGYIRQGDSDSREEVESCPTLVTVRWEPGQGFSEEQQDGDCKGKRPARIVEISREGKLSSHVTTVKKDARF
jgi:hypothetical protein